MAPPLDPRTVPRDLLLQRLGDRRPHLTLMMFGGSAWPEDLPLSADLATAIPGTTIQLLRNSETSLARATAADCNALGERALGSMLVLLPASPWRIAELVHACKRLAAEEMCGAVALGRAQDGLATRAAAWHAFLGLAPELSLHLALADYHVRLRSIGYLAHQAALNATSTGHKPTRRDVGLALYTAITAAYDTLKPLPLHLLDGCHASAFIDAASQPRAGASHRGWKVVEAAFPGADAARQSRFPKINAHLVLPDAEISLWIDASIGIACPYPLRQMAEHFLRDADMCVFTHHARQSVREEAEACIAYGLDDAGVIARQLQRHADDGFADDQGLAELPVILRRHTPAVRAFNELWWKEVSQGARRDQLSFPYAAWKTGLRCRLFPAMLADRNGLFVKYGRGGHAPPAPGT